MLSSGGHRARFQIRRFEFEYHQSQLFYSVNCSLKRVKISKEEEEAKLGSQILLNSGQSYKAIYARKLRLYSHSINNFLVSTTLAS